MKPELTSELRSKFLCEYIGCDIQVGQTTTAKLSLYATTANYIQLTDCIANKNYILLLRPISSISDDEAIEVADMAYLTGKKRWTITKRDKTGVWMNGVDHLEIGYYFRLNEYGEIHSSSTFGPGETVDNNIGRVGTSCNNGVSYINIVDYLRGKGFALPFHGHSVKTLVEAGWIKLIEG